MKRPATPYTPPRAWVFAASLTLMTTPAMAQGPAAEGERVDLAPTEARWQPLPHDVSGVSVDRSGRAWFEIGFHQMTIGGLRSQLQQAGARIAPWFSGGRVVLHDARGRVWVVANGSGKLVGYDPATGEWIEREAGPPGAPPPADGGRDLAFRFVAGVDFPHRAIEGADGKLFFADWTGIHVLEGTAWSYHPTFELNARYGLTLGKKPLAGRPVQFCRDRQGRVYAWSEWGRSGSTGTLGFFVYENGAWGQRLVKDWRGPDGTGAPPPEARDERRNNDANRLSGVVPLSEGRVLVCTQSGVSAVVSLRPGIEGEAARKEVQADIGRLGDESYAVREAAQKRLVGRGVCVLPLVKAALENGKDLEASSRLKAVLAEALGLPEGQPLVDGWRLGHAWPMGLDAAGNAWLFSNHAVDPAGKGANSVVVRVSPEGRVSPLPAGAPVPGGPGEILADRRGRVWSAQLDRGVVVYDAAGGTVVTDQGQIDFRWLHGEDRHGRVFLRGRGLWACRPQAPDGRAQLPVTISEVPRSGVVACLDSLGRTWAVLAHEDPKVLDTLVPPRLCRFEKGQWVRDDVPGGICPTGGPCLTTFLPLAGGRLLIHDPRNNRAYWYDGKTWQPHESLRALIEARHRELGAALDPREAPWQPYPRLRADAGGRIWLLNDPHGQLYDGRQWLSLRKAMPDETVWALTLAPLPGTAKMLVAKDRLYEARPSGSGVVAEPWNPGAATPLAPNDAPERWNLWIDPLGRPWVPLRSACLLVTDKAVRRVDDVGPPIAGDSRGGVWFLNANEAALTYLAPDGRRARLCDRALGQSFSMASDRHGRWWLLTTRGLLCLRLARAADGSLAIEEVGCYQKSLPATAYRLWVDAQDNLWIHSEGPRNFRLHRVTLPAPPASWQPATATAP